MPLIQKDLQILQRIQRWMVAATRSTTFYPTSVLCSVNLSLLSACTVSRVTLRVLMCCIHLCVLRTLVGFADSASAQPRLLRSLVCFVDKRLLGVLWLWMHHLFSFLEGVLTFITRRLKIFLGYVDNLIVSRMNKSINPHDCMALASHSDVASNTCCRDGWPRHRLYATAVFGSIPWVQWCRVFRVFKAART